ncbi:hypothetical protein EIP91_006319 [Steccherinum ochraceum]|uniref:CTP-dependent diacylglycerol kinase 1 n=1 Tax=Steccherinum ochraceum TaxID=92696 RepID=A0A4R0RRC2_9APHY|nr:hypothetical protein EIP91_006319 [Steccherinum ochraceum]
MTLPANDAFTLGLTGNHDSSRPSYPLSLRQTSPKIPFVSSSKPSSRSSPRSPSGSQGKAPSKRSMSNGTADSPLKGTSMIGNGKELSESKDVARKANGSAVKKASAPIDWEIPRKTLHSSIGLITLYLYTHHVPPRPVIIALSSFLAIAVPADVLRLNSPAFERLFETCLGLFMRDSEKKSTNGVIWYILGVIFVLGVYPVDVAVVSILILAFADTAASTIGRLWGYLTPPLPRHVPVLGLPLAPRKSVAGFIAAALTGAAVVAGFWGWAVGLGVAEPLWTWEAGLVESQSMLLSGWSGLGVLSVVGGLISGIAEALDLGSLDDNLTLPIISGGCIWGFIKLLTTFAS